MASKAVKVISLVLIILLLAPVVNQIFLPQRAVVQAVEVDRKTVYKGLLITGVIIATINLLSGDSTGDRSNSKEKVVAGSKDELYWLAKAVHAEARGEPFRGQVAVAAVILNRVENSQFPDTIYSVIFQKKQFSSVDDGQIHLEPNETSYRAARAAVEGEDPSRGAIYFYNPETARFQNWFRTREVTVQIGQHVFAK